ncbi:integrase core domain-containing protein [Lentzea albidocapillata]|uniref:integrase core domain-containing protein n=1 Tax=Lentzea albidocapillata TaxID=40571 RepID=UPI0009FF752D|nr:integrase core domain-containing protein [Lentzea albidocapillata]
MPTGIRMPRMNSFIERWVKTFRAELLERTMIWNQTHLRCAPQEYERHYNEHRTHRSLAGAAPLRGRPQPLELDQIERLSVDRQGRLGGVISAAGIPGRRRSCLRSWRCRGRDLARRRERMAGTTTQAVGLSLWCGAAPGGSGSLLSLCA